MRSNGDALELLFAAAVVCLSLIKVGIKQQQTKSWLVKLETNRKVEKLNSNRKVKAENQNDFRLTAEAASRANCDLKLEQQQQQQVVAV